MDDPNYVRIDDIVTNSEIATILGVLPSAVTNWKTRYSDFPKPFAQIGPGKRGTSLWRRSEVIDWYTRQGPGVRGRSMDIETMRAIVEAHDKNQGAQ